MNAMTTRGRSAMKNKKEAKDLVAGDRILTPRTDRKWRRGPLTVLAVEEGCTDKRGLWLNVKASFVSPYGRIVEAIFHVRPDTMIACIEGEEIEEA